MKIIVLGGHGFLGKHVVRLATQKGWSVTALSRRDGCDITDLNAFTSKLAQQRPEIVINCAAHVGSVQYALRNAAEMIHDNMQIVLNIYRAVQHACPSAKVINPISNCSYPGDADNHYEPDWLHGPVHDSVLPYGATRRMIFAVAECYRKQYGLNSVNWLIANAFGPGDYTDPDRVHALNGIVIRLIKAQRAGDQEFEIWGSGKPVREWCYVEDAAKMLVDSVKLQSQIYPLNLAQNEAYSIADIARIAADALNFDVQFVFNTQYADGAPTKILDDRKFRQQHPDFQFTALQEGVQRTIDYYQGVLK